LFMKRPFQFARRWAVFVVAALSVAMASGQQKKRPAIPIDPVTAILDAFQSHSIVAVGDGGHGWEQGHAFRLALIRDPRFPATVNDIAVEFGNSRYQDLMDQFTRGENVSSKLLQEAWHNTTQPLTQWDLSIYEEFYRAVRVVNASLPNDRKLRILLGDPPVDQDDPRRTIPEQVREFGSRDIFPASVVQREVVAKHRRALLIYGDGHLKRGGNPPNVVDLLERAGSKVFTIRTNGDNADLEELQPDISKWPVPSLTMIRGTVLEGAPFHSLPYPATTIEAGEGRFDALLYFGHPLTITYARFAKERCEDVEYIRMRSRRSRNPEFDKILRAECALPLPMLPQLWRTYQAKGIAATLALAPAASSGYSGGATDLYRLGQTLLKRRKFDDAISILELNTTLFPRDVPSLNSLAEAYTAKGYAFDALRTYQRTLAISRGDPAARKALGLDR
jgi:hypothetical protein